ncbi:MAG TPA: ABC transporter ATP-binding protein [Bacillota bacterium]|nr:ABC transporter ATP-binding protein [Bacillota bacterium]
MLIKTVNICKTYDMGKVQVKALRGVDLTIDRGEFVSIMGPSGSGKSTLLNILGCLDRPTSGQYFLEGMDVSGLSDSELAHVRNQKIGFVFQSFYLIPRYTALKNVELPMIYAGVPPAQRRKSALAALEKVDMLDRSDHLPGELSGGQKQRVAIARALVNDPAIILADEPTGNLDSTSGAEIISIFEALNAEGVTVVIVTHEHHIARSTRRTLSFWDGEIIGDTAPEEYKPRF